MANTNTTNLLSVGSSKNVAVTSQSASAKYKNAAQVDRKNNFDSHLDKAQTQVNQNQNQQPEKVEGDSTETAEKIQGQNTKTQDAPPQENLETPPENISEGTEEVTDADEVQENPAIFSYLFSANTETLLAVKNFDTETEGNLMTIIPQSSDGKSQTMLDLLGGKTWTSADVTAEFQNLNAQPQMQNFQPQTNLNQQVQVENIQSQNLNQQVQVENIQPQNLNQQAQVENIQPQNLNQQVQVENIQPQNLNQQVQVENIQSQNLNQQVQVENIQSQNLNQQSAQVENIQPQNLNQQSAQVENIQSQNLNQQSAQVENIQPQNLNQQSAQVETQQPQQTLSQQTAQVQNQAQQFGNEISQVVNSVQPQVQNQNQPTVQNVADLLGVNVQVEDGQQISPTVPTQQTSQNFEQNNQQSNAQNFSQNLTQATSPELQQTTSQTATGGENFAANFAQANNISQPVEQVAQVQSPEVTANVREDFNVPTQIVEQARLIRTAQNTEMVINLKPEHLGELTLRISVNHSGALTANFYTDNAQARAIIDNSLVQLRQELNNAGIKVENVEVFAGLSDGGLSNGQGNAAWQQNQQQRNSNRKIDFSAFEDEASATQPVNTSETSDGVDYKV